MSLWIHVTSPTCAVQGGVVHAVEAITSTPRAMRSTRKTVDTLCGLQRARRIGVGTCDREGNRNGSMTVPWPPYVEEMRSQGYDRCPECMKLRPGKPNLMVPVDQRYDPSQKKAPRGGATNVA